MTGSKQGIFFVSSVNSKRGASKPTPAVRNPRVSRLPPVPAYTAVKMHAELVSKLKPLFLVKKAQARRLSLRSPESSAVIVIQSVAIETQKNSTLAAISTPSRAVYPALNPSSLRSFGLHSRIPILVHHFRASSITQRFVPTPRKECEGGVGCLIPRPISAMLSATPSIPVEVVPATPSRSIVVPGSVEDIHSPTMYDKSPETEVDSCVSGICSPSSSSSMSSIASSEVSFALSEMTSFTTPFSGDVSPICPDVLASPVSVCLQGSHSSRPISLLSTSPSPMAIPPSLSTSEDAGPVSYATAFLRGTASSSGAPSMRLRKFWAPPMAEDAVVSSNPRIQLEISALRSQKKVAGGGTASPGDGRLKSLVGMAIVSKVRAQWEQAQ
ncbi:hypothetical protein BV22DRAFT_1051752 [Leucogyrophana mollusca]|uniref:Uncharacterized protein n=1 Tax=Leucogyrophana mollusca TaxID=85980 RepID=A0ACB8AYC5_9AGAM|nr:hypothetical protein BV22DRAFT_1051752 [Leucogyrophana mollusca]